MRTLIKQTDTFDQINTLPVGVKKGLPATGILMQDYEKEGDGIFWIMQKSAMLKAVYSAEDKAENERLKSETPLTDGETVLIEGKEYQFKLLGDFSNIGIFNPVD